jgi:DNA polymerase-3 subunit gamma/tau
MSYQVIARKWRPQSFDQLVGQNHISQTLQNALKNGRLPHALLFTGPRGTGKTSSARILAKSLRCPKAVNFVPCNVCPECQDITASRSVDVIEIDGASNNGVDAIRELRDTVAYAPASGKYKVYIIDEVHMLSTSAFNALLKTLEEPPEHVIFILATTEAHKIPQTILSRCQRFDFRSISTRQITDRLKEICDKEGVTAEEDALWIIARQGDGSMRDSQSLLDQVITFANGPLTRESVIGILGLTDRTLLLEVLSALVARDVAAILQSLEKITTAAYEPSLFANDLLENVRHLLLIKISSAQPRHSPASIIELPDSELRFLKDLGATTGEEDIHMLFDMCLKGAGDIAKASEPRIVLEMLLLRMAQAPRLMELAQLLSGQAGAAVTGPSTTMAVAAARPLTAPAQAMSATSATASTTATPRASLGNPMSLPPQERWYEFVQKIRKSDALLGAKIENLLFTGEKDKVLSLAVPPKMAFLKDQLADADIRKNLQSLIEQHWGSGFTLTIQIGKDEAVGTSARGVAEQKEKKQTEDLAEKVANHPLIKSATTALKGQVKSIKSPQTPSK